MATLSVANVVDRRKMNIGGECTMKTLCQSLLLSISALALGGTAYAQVPVGSWTGNDISDENQNTGMGTGALGTAATNGGTDNTASGYHALYSNTTGSSNTAAGYEALLNNTTGIQNTACGEVALYTNTTGDSNTASGGGALFSNTTGIANTASGVQALLSNTTGDFNTASGVSALLNNTTGSNNTASGHGALQANTSGVDNTASGVAALVSNTIGNYNTASGYGALLSNAGGNYNNASGYYALHNNSGGSQNSATGVQALYANKTGNYNTASGTDALYANTTGSTNIALGYKAGYSLTTGSNNIDIGNLGTAAESGTIRIGTPSTHLATYIAGIYGTAVTGASVVVSYSGQLGVTVSAERFKTAVAPMGSYTAKLSQLRPVTYHLKTDPAGALQTGLIAEEVAKIYPELVIRDQNGRIDGVRYDELAPMLLNEAQQQAARIRDLEQQVSELKDLKQQMAVMSAGFQKLQSREGLVAQR
jgi:hypothetical protein